MLTDQGALQSGRVNDHPKMQSLENLGPLQLADPNIPVPNRIVMILKTQRLLYRVRHILWSAFGRRRAFDLRIVLNQDPVMKHSHRRRFQKFALLIEPWSVIDDIVNLPLTRFSTG